MSRCPPPRLWVEGSYMAGGQELGGEYRRYSSVQERGCGTLPGLASVPQEVLEGEAGSLEETGQRRQRKSQSSRRAAMGRGV